jgi:hypothetical protein
MNMTRQIALGLVVAMVISSAAVEAQMGGLIRRKAGEIVGGKKPAPAPATPAPTEPAPATPGTAGTKTASPAKSGAAVSPLEISALPVNQSANEVLRGSVTMRSNGDWDRLPFIPPAAVAAARVLGESAQTALVDTVGAALKSLVMSPAFLTQHSEYIKTEHKAVDHGLTGVVSMEDALKKNDLKTVEALQARQVVAMNVDMVTRMPGDILKTEFTRELAQWKTYAADAKRRNRAKYQKMVAVAQTIEAVPGTDDTFKRGYAVIKSIDNDGPDTEAAVYAMHARVTQEAEQAAYDQHNLKGQLRQQLTTFVAVASKVNFNAQTVEKGGKTKFVNPRDEAQGALWKACFRAGEAPTAAAVKLAKAWLSEL